VEAVAQKTSRKTAAMLGREKFGGSAMRLDMTRKVTRISVLLAVGLAASIGFGQNANTGEIKGTVSDPSGAVVSGVTVTITNVQTGVNTVTTTNPAGIYDVPSIPTGEYRITFSKNGFRTTVREGLILQIQTLGIDATLQVGTTSEQIVVTAE
jgi:Carboxypeptidase regulatory-like domain